MDYTLVNISEDAFEVLFPLVPNHMNPNAAWAIYKTGGCLFKTYGREFEFILLQDERTVWTMVDGDDGSLHLVSGCHDVNHIGYLISRVVLPEAVEVHVRLDSRPHGTPHNRGQS
jgi:hypothetical protein